MRRKYLLFFYSSPCQRPGESMPSHGICCHCCHGQIFKNLLKKLLDRQDVNLAWLFLRALCTKCHLGFMISEKAWLLSLKIGGRGMKEFFANDSQTLAFIKILVEDVMFSIMGWTYVKTFLHVTICWLMEE